MDKGLKNITQDTFMRTASTLLSPKTYFKKSLSKGPDKRTRKMNAKTLYINQVKKTSH